MVGDARQECGEVPGVTGAGDTTLLGDMRAAKIGRESQSFQDQQSYTYVLTSSSELCGGRRRSLSNARFHAD